MAVATVQRLSQKYATQSDKPDEQEEFVLGDQNQHQKVTKKLNSVLSNWWRNSPMLAGRKNYGNSKGKLCHQSCDFVATTKSGKEDAQLEPSLSALPLQETSQNNAFADSSFSGYASSSMETPVPTTVTSPVSSTQSPPTVTSSSPLRSFLLRRRRKKDVLYTRLNTSNSCQSVNGISSSLEEDGHLKSLCDLEECSGDQAGHPIYDEVDDFHHSSDLSNVPSDQDDSNILSLQNLCQNSDCSQCQLQQQKIEMEEVEGSKNFQETAIKVFEEVDEDISQQSNNKNLSSIFKNKLIDGILGNREQENLQMLMRKKDQELLRLYVLKLDEEANYFNSRSPLEDELCTCPKCQRYYVEYYSRYLNDYGTNQAPVNSEGTDPLDTLEASIFMTDDIYMNTNGMTTMCSIM